MHNLTKIFLTSLALTLGACDSGDLADDFGEGATAFRPIYGGFQLNTSFIGGHEHDELDLSGAAHDGARLTKVCLSGKRGVCIYPTKDELYVEKAQIFAKRGDIVYSGTDFINSRWYLELDYNRDGVADSTIDTLIVDAKPNATTQTGIPYWDYFWSFDSKSATGLITKYLKPAEGLTPMCEADADTNSLGSVVLEHTSIDTSPATKGLVEEVKDVMFIACHSGAAGKAPTWGYVLYDLGHEAYTGAIRVMRADYCNDGVSWTEPGEEVAITDSLVISDQYDPANKLEGLASFKSGWVCINRPRLADLHDVTSACDIKVCESGDLGDYGSDIMTQLAPAP